MALVPDLLEQADEHRVGAVPMRPELHMSRHPLAPVAELERFHRHTGEHRGGVEPLDAALRKSARGGLRPPFPAKLSKVALGSAGAGDSPS